MGQMTAQPVSVSQAERLIMAIRRDLGVETDALDGSIGRVLRADIVADRDIPAGNVSTMDGIAIGYRQFAAGRREFRVSATQAAGKPPIRISNPEDCVEITTGAELAPGLDSVVPYEQLRLNNGMAELVSADVRRWQYVRRRGEDTRAGATLIKTGARIGPKELAIAATVGATGVKVSKLPRVAVISTGDELVEISATPASYQIRRSNGPAIAAVLWQHGLGRPDTRHLPDDPAVMRRLLASCLAEHDVIILSGGVSKGAFDYVPGILVELGVQPVFAGVKQKPGKPLWVGSLANGAVVFALPGNPLSSLLCLHRYVLPWLSTTLGSPAKPLRARLERDMTFAAPLQFFPLVSLRHDRQGQLLATPVKYNSSGDLTAFAGADGFIELPAARKIHRRGRVYRVWPFLAQLEG